jgi:multiple sugar transport system permease protein
MNQSVRARLSWNVSVNVIGFVLLVFFLGPLLWILNTSFMLERELTAIPPHWLPEQPTLDNYVYVLTGQVPESYAGRAVGSRMATEALRIGSGLVNSLIVATATALLNLVFAGAAAFTIARQEFAFKTPIFALILMTRLIPPVALAIPYFVILDQLQLLDSLLALIIIYLVMALPFTIWFLTLYFRNLPRDIEEAAMIDGCTRLGALARVVAPVAMSGLIAAGTFAFMLAYSEFTFALFLTKSEASQTVPVVLTNVAINYDISYSLLSADIVLAILPAIALALVFRTQIRRGLALLSSN